MKKLTVRDAAALLNASEKSVYRWIKQGLLPAYRINDQYRINRAELLEWATARKLHVAPEIFAEPESEGAPTPTLEDALRAGGIHYRVGGHDKASVLRAVVETMKLPDDVDHEFLYQVLLAREALGSTGIGDGIAIPHVRNPIVLHLSRPTVTLCFLERPVDFGALDGQPVARCSRWSARPCGRTCTCSRASRSPSGIRGSRRRFGPRLPAKRSSKRCRQPKPR